MKIEINLPEAGISLETEISEAEFQSIPPITASVRERNEAIQRLSDRVMFPALSVLTDSVRAKKAA